MPPCQKTPGPARTSRGREPGCAGREAEDGLPSLGSALRPAGEYFQVSAGLVGVEAPLGRGHRVSLITECFCAIHGLYCLPNQMPVTVMGQVMFKYIINKVDLH